MYISKRAMVVSALLILMFSATTWVLAQVDGVIYACVNPAGSIRIVEESAACLPRETILEWNMQGEKGDKGDEGDVGPAGPQGPAGILGFYTVEETRSCDTGQLCVLISYCNEGDYVTGGGLSKSIWNAFDDPGVAVISMQPLYEKDSDQWAYLTAISNLNTDEVDFTAYAICAEMP